MAQDELVVYTWQLFQKPAAAASVRWIEGLRSSGFTTVILWTLHVMPNGDVYYNSPTNPANLVVSGGVFQADNYGHLGDCAAALKGGASSVTKVLFCVGSAVDSSVGSVDDFQNIDTLIRAGQGQILQDNFGALAEAVPAIDGYDFDNESPAMTSYVDSMATFTGMLAEQGKVVTYCPYDNEGFWISALQQVYTNRAVQAVQSFHLQCYAGGTGNSPSVWAASLQQAGTASTGISNTAAFVIPGVASTSVEDVQQQVDQLAQNEPQIPGAFLWPANADFSNVDFSSATTQFPLQKYAEAIRDGLASGRSYPNG